jgi:dTDP-4-dehydrorhamnose reductase
LAEVIRPEQVWPERVWLVTGGSGQVGGALAAAPPAGVRIVAPPRAVLDLASDRLDIAALLAAEGVTAIVNCGAYTQVDKAEDEPELAQRINAQAPALLAEAARGAGIPIIQVSTDYVFAGDKPEPYVEDDATRPQGAYGRSKLAGERAVAGSGARHAILRTAWVFSPGGANFVRTMLRLGRERDAVSVVADQHGCPTHAGDLAAVISAIVPAFEDARQSSGIWHAVNAGETTWHGLAERIFARAALRGQPAPRLTAIATADYPTRAPRPANSRLATDRLQRDFGIILRPWQDAVDEAVDALVARDGKEAA